MSKNYWIQNVSIKKGALHRQLGISQKKKIPMKLLRKIKDTPIGKKVKVGRKSVKVTYLLKRRAVLAYNLRRARK